MIESLPVKWFDVAQNSPEWEAMRVGKVTASCFHIFMANEGKSFGDPAKEYALKLALEQLTGKKSEYGFTSKELDRGHEQEPLAVMRYEDDLFEQVTNGGFFDCGAWGDSPDGLVRTEGIIEVKSVIPKVQFANQRRGSIDPAYKWQVIGHLDCTGREWCDFVSFCSDYFEDKKLIVYRTHRDQVQDELKRLHDRRTEFLAFIEATKKEVQAA